jgi:hypothetical protein
VPEDYCPAITDPLKLMYSIPHKNTIFLVPLYQVLTRYEDAETADFHKVSKSAKSLHLGASERNTAPKLGLELTVPIMKIKDRA